jgi:hypothetical protein
VSTGGDASASAAGGAASGEKGKTARRNRGLRAKPARFKPGGAKARRGTVLVFRLARPARLLVTVFGPGPSCARLGTFSRPGRQGLNEVPFSGTLFGRALAPGRYAVVVEAIRGSERVRIGRVLIVILARDGREGGNRPLAAPVCDGGDALASLATGGGDFSRVSLASNDASGRDDGPSAGGVAGASASGGANGDDDGPLLPNLPALPELPTIVPEDPFSVPPWAFVALAIMGALGAAALLGAGIRRRRGNAGWD